LKYTSATDSRHEKNTKSQRAYKFDPKTRFLHPKRFPLMRPLPTACCLLLTAHCLLFTACGSPNTPLDAGTRRVIDSISTYQINLARTELDTLCQRQRVAEMPLLVDSIKQIRLREIEEKLKTVPR